MFEDKVKQSFSKVKEDISSLNDKIVAIEAKLDQILAKSKKENTNSTKYKGFERSTPQIYEKTDKISTGNKGVHSFIHSTDIHSFNSHSLDIQSLKKNLEEKINKLTNQEFLVFLTIYQLEEDLRRNVTYDDLSSKLSLSTGCIRSYISSIIKKGLPILKKKINNRTITLTIHQDFKELNLKERLTNLYYHKDPNQTRLS